MACCALPTLVTHIYHPVRGPFRNLCDLDDDAALAIIAAMRESGRPKLTPDYLPRRHATEDWLCAAATGLLGEPVNRPLYAFLGSFGHRADPSRPLALRWPLAALGRITFTLGDSMGVATRADRRLHDRATLAAYFAANPAECWQFSDQDDESASLGFVEVQIWGREGLPPPDQASSVAS